MFNLDSLNYEQKFALLFGIMAGDGCLSLVKGKKKFVAITGGLGDLKFFEEVVSILLKEFRGKHTNIKHKKDCNAIEYNFHDYKLFDFISSHGFPIGKKGQDLIIPEFFYDKELVRHIVQGFFATDGSLVLTKNPNKFYPRIEARVIHKDFLKQVYDYLISLGLKGAYYECGIRPDSRWKIIQDQFRFQFNGKENLHLFNNLVGFVNPRHRNRFSEFVNYDEEYTNAIKGVAPKNIGVVRKKIHLNFFNS